MLRQLHDICLGPTIYAVNATANRRFTSQTRKPEVENETDMSSICMLIWYPTPRAKSGARSFVCFGRNFRLFIVLQSLQTCFTHTVDCSLAGRRENLAENNFFHRLFQFRFPLPVSGLTRKSSSVPTTSLDDLLVASW